jgi:hypothetical protein
MLPDDPTQGDSPLTQSDITNVQTGTTGYPRKRGNLFFHFLRRIVLALLALALVGAAVEYFVPTPFSRYIERYTGPRVRTLRRALVSEKFDYVYRAVKPRFASNPANADYLELLTASSTALLKQELASQEWDRARAQLEDTTSLPKIPTDLRASLRRMYVSAMPERFRRTSRNAGDTSKILESEWIYIQSLAANEPNDAEVQFETGRTLAYLSPPGQSYNPESLRYFEVFLATKPEEKAREPIEKALESSLSGPASSETSQLARKMIAEYYAARFTPKLKAALQLSPFGDTQVVPPSGTHNQRQNAYILLTGLNKKDTLDEIRFHLGNALNAQDFRGEDAGVLKESLVYVLGVKSAEALRSEAKLPKFLPIGILSQPPSSARFVEVKPLLFGKLASLATPYCHERLFSERAPILSQNCYSLLLAANNLTPAEKRKWSATHRKAGKNPRLPPPRKRR